MTVTGIGLISGGLDSMLAARLLMEQGIEVVGISFTTPFFNSLKAEAAARQIGFRLLVRDITSFPLSLAHGRKRGLSPISSDFRSACYDAPMGFVAMPATYIAAPPYVVPNKKTGCWIQIRRPSRSSRAKTRHVTRRARSK